jgi:hypothetical protein
MGAPLVTAPTKNGFPGRETSAHRRGQSMNVLIQKSAPVKQSGRVCGRGLARRKLSLEQRKGLAADLLTGAREFQPSLTQTASLLGGYARPGPGGAPRPGRAPRPGAAGGARRSRERARAADQCPDCCLGWRGRVRTDGGGACHRCCPRLGCDCCRDFVGQLGAGREMGGAFLISSRRQADDRTTDA